jgi:hypothetical protein
VGGGGDKFIKKFYKLKFSSYPHRTLGEPPDALNAPTFHPTSYSPIFVYLLYIDLYPCLEGHLDPELIQVPDANETGAGY